MTTKIAKTTFIAILPQAIQEQIKADLLDSYNDMDFNDYTDTLEESLENAMNGRICDLEDTIDINKYLK